MFSAVITSDFLKNPSNIRHLVKNIRYDVEVSTLEILPLEQFCFCLCINDSNTGAE